MLRKTQIVWSVFSVRPPAMVVGLGTRWGGLEVDMRVCGYAGEAGEAARRRGHQLGMKLATKRGVVSPLLLPTSHLPSVYFNARVYQTR